MPIDTISTDQLVTCPSCGALMHLSQIVPAFSGLPEMQGFECAPCGLAVTAEQILQFSEFTKSEPMPA